MRCRSSRPGPAAFAVVVPFLLRAAALVSRFLDEPPRRISALKNIFSAVVGVGTVVVDSALSPVDWCTPVLDVTDARKPLQ